MAVSQFDRANSFRSNTRRRPALEDNDLGCSVSWLLVGIAVVTILAFTWFAPPSVDEVTSATRVQATIDTPDNSARSRSRP